MFSNETDIETIQSQFLKLLNTPQNELNCRFNDFKKFQNAFRSTENPQALSEIY